MKDCPWGMKSKNTERKKGRPDTPLDLTYLAIQNYGSKVAFKQEIRAHLGIAICYGALRAIVRLGT